MRRSYVTFACELDPERLTTLFADPVVIADLQALDARISLMLSDLSTERASVVQKLNAASIPLVGVPLVPVEEGYYFTADNTPQAARRYEEWKVWTAQHNLVWEQWALTLSQMLSSTYRSWTIPGDLFRCCCRAFATRNDYDGHRQRTRRSWTGSTPMDTKSRTTSSHSLLTSVGRGPHSSRDCLDW
jgi:hypothetical protein